MVLGLGVCEALRRGGSGELESRYLWGPVMGSQLGRPHEQWDPVLPGLLSFLEKLRDLDFYVKTADSYNLAANVQFLCTT